MGERKVHIVAHTHWDREWYFSTCDSLVLMDQTITNILEELEKNERVTFCLDGQISIVEEYLLLHPEQKQLMQKLVDEHRLLIGPWYTQTDTQLVSMSSIIQNLYYGIYRSKELFSTYMKIGYLPDTFGFSNQIPMLLKQFEIDDFIFWRGIDFEKQHISPYFTWIGQDGSSVTAANLVNGYAMAQGLNTDDVFVKNMYEPLLKQYAKLSDASDILVTVGGDQHTIVPDLDKKVEALDSNAMISSYETFMKAIKGKEQGSYCGEFREGRYSRVHKSAGSIRSSIKKSNYEAEQSLTRGLQPLNVMAQAEGFGVSHQLIWEAWKLLFEGQAHDGIVGCVSDSVAEDLLNRNKRALEISSSAQNLIKKQFAKAVHLQEDEILVFNTETNPFVGYKTVEIISHDEAVEIEGVESCTLLETRKQKGYENALVETANGKFYEKEQDYYFHKLLIHVCLPSFGYRVLKFHGVNKKDTAVSSQSISNNLYTITFENGTLRLAMKDGEIQDFLRLYECGNDGDTYDFSPLKGDKEHPLAMHKAQVYVDSAVEIMKIDATALLPYDLKDRLQPTQKAECPCTITLRLQKDSLIHVRIDFDNKVLSHRLRLRIKSLHKGNQTIAATPGGYVLRDICTEPVHPDWNKTHVEYPIDIETNSGFVGFHGVGKQLVIFNKGCKEYQANQESIAVTLFATCGELGKPDLLYRPGRASGDTTKKGHMRIMTPLAQELHPHAYELAISFMEPDPARMYLQLQQYESADIFYQLQNINLFYERIDNKIQAGILHKKSLKKKASYLELPADILIYNLYHSLYDNDIRIRFMSLRDINRNEAGLPKDCVISNLLEQGDYQDLKAYRIYTMRGNINEH